MLDKIRSLFSRPDSEGDDGGPQLDLGELHDDLQRLIAHNRVRLAENENLMARVEASMAEDEAVVRGDFTDFRKRCALRRVRTYRKRLKSLTRCSSIYNDNINMHISISERLEDMRVSGLKTISVNMLEEIAVDNEEKYKEHREMVNAVKSMTSGIDAPETFDDDPELRELARECGLL